VFQTESKYTRGRALAVNRSEFVVARELGLSITTHCTKRLNPTT